MGVLTSYCMKINCYNHLKNNMATLNYLEDPLTTLYDPTIPLLEKHLYTH